MRKIIFFVLFLANTLLFAQTNTALSKTDAFLKKYVASSGKVNYKSIKANPKELKAAIEELTAQTPQQLNSNEQLAYWINIYNLFTVKLISENYPLTSIKNLDNGNPWDVKRIELGGKKYSLNDIENNQIRTPFKDARIHFAVNCAAKSCPPLLAQAFTGANVQKLLSERTRQFIQSKNNVITKNSLKISKIFEWYKADFGDLIPFLNQYSAIKIDKNAKITYLEYDWSLNE